MKVSDLKNNPDNPRIIKDAAFLKLKKSIKEFPQMMELRPMVIDSEGFVLGGNMRLQAIKDLKMKEIPDSWVKRADDLTEEQKREFVIKDNSGFGEWDWDAIANEWSDLPLADWGLDIPSFEVDTDSSEEADLERYTKKIDAPVYEPKGEKPSLDELYDETKTNSLIEKIEKSNVSSELKFFLKKAAQRQRVFRYDKIAEYYSHLSETEQELFEDLVLVIIDFDDAIAKGYVKLSQKIAEIYKNEQATK